MLGDCERGDSLLKRPSTPTVPAWEGFRRGDTGGLGELGGGGPRLDAPVWMTRPLRVTVMRYQRGGGAHTYTYVL